MTAATVALLGVAAGLGAVETARFPTVIVPHGWGSNAARMLPLASVLQAEGFGVLLYDARGHRTSALNAPVTIRTFTEDLLVAVDYLTRRTAKVHHNLSAESPKVAGDRQRRRRTDRPMRSSFGHLQPSPWGTDRGPEVVLRRAHEPVLSRIE